MLVLPASRLLQGFAELEEEWTPDYSTDKTWRETRVPAFLAAWRMINRLTFAHAGHVHCWCASACRVWFKRFFRKGACKSSEQGWNQDAAETYMVKAWVCTTLRVCFRAFCCVGGPVLVAPAVSVDFPRNSGTRLLLFAWPPSILFHFRLMALR